MKPKLSQPTGVCCYCVLSESHCSATPVSSLFFSFFFPLCVFACGIYIYIFLFSWQQSIFLSFFFFWLIFCHLFHYHKSTFSISCGLSASQGVHIFAGNVATFLGQVLHVSVFSLKKSCCGILNPFMACFKSCWVEKGEHKDSQCTWQERPGQKGKLCDFHNPQSISQDQMRPYEPSCQQPIEVSPTGIGGFLSLRTQLVVSAINQHSHPRHHWGCFLGCCAARRLTSLWLLFGLRQR